VAGLDLIAAPIVEPVELADATAHLRVDDDHEDGLVLLYVAAARSHIETFLKASLLATTWRVRIDGGFPREIRLPVGPVLSTDGLAITYVDDAGATQTLPADQYQASLGETGVIRPAWGVVWPSTRAQLDAVSVTFKAGWPGPSDLPPAIKAAVLLMTGHLFQHREATSPAGVVTELPLGVRHLLLPVVRSS
jgi:uncharacterized phiE125 gp8 family phage protein